MNVYTPALVCVVSVIVILAVCALIVIVIVERSLQPNDNEDAE